MAIKLFVLVCWGWISGWILVCSAASDPINITAQPGDNVTLSCRAPSSTNIIVVEWNRPDLEPQYVFVYRDGQSHPHNQNEYFKNRVELKDSEMKDRDVSLVLRNVMTGDRGTYKCFVVQEKTLHWETSIDPISIVHLSVRQPGSTGGQTGEGGDEDGGDKDGGAEGGGSTDRNLGLTVGLPVVAVVLVAGVVGFLIYRKQTTHRTGLIPTCGSSTSSTGGHTGEGGAKEGGAKEGGNMDGNSGGNGLMVGLSDLVGSVLMKYKRRMKKNPHPPPPPDEEAGDQQLL